MKLKNFKVSLATALVSILASGSAHGADGHTPRQQTAVDTSRLSPELVGIGKLVQSGVNEKVVLTYIQNTPPKRNLTAEELVYLHELGLSSEGIITLLNAVPKVSLSQTAPPAQPALQQGQSQESASNSPIAATPAPPRPKQSEQVLENTVISLPPTVVYTQPAPATVYVERPPVVTYVEPAPRFSFGLSLGHDFGHHHGGGHYFGGLHGGHHGAHHGGGHHGRHH